MALPYSDLAHLFLEVRTQIKLYHWQTRSYARHKATDRFIETFEPLVDRFVEAAQGIMIAEAHGGPPRLYNRSKRLGGDDRIKNYTDLTLEQRQVVENFSSPMTDNNAERFLSQFSSYMATLELPQSELAQIRDDMLEITDVTLYLFTLQ